MNLIDLFTLQGTLFLLILTGALLRKIGIITDEGKKVLSDLCMFVVIPCNILKSFVVELPDDVLKNAGMLLIASVIMHVLLLVLNRFTFNRVPEQKKKILQYCTLVSMSGFLGVPIAEGLFSSLGVLYTAIYLIPMRVISWSVGTTYFVAGATVDKKKVIKNVLTHPCLVAVYLGLILLVTGLKLPEVIIAPIKHIGNCNSALTMFIVGTLLADVKLRSIWNKTTLLFSGYRLLVLPAIAMGIGLLLGLTDMPQSINTLMIAMPAGATAAIFATRYHGDEGFASSCIVVSTLLSMLTLPLWGFILGH